MQKKRKRSESVLWQKPLHSQKNPKIIETIQKPPQETSIIQRLRTDLGRSVGVTAVTPLVWLNRFTKAQSQVLCIFRFTLIHEDIALMLFRYCKTLIICVTLFLRGQSECDIFARLYFRGSFRILFYNSCTINYLWGPYIRALVYVLTNKRKNNVLANKKCFTVSIS